MPVDTSSAGNLATFPPDAKPRRDNHFGTDTDEQSDDDQQSHIAQQTLDISRHKAHRILKENADLYCGRTLHAPAWNGGRTAEQIAWIEADVDVDQLPDIEAAIDGSQLIDGRGDQLHREQRPVRLSDADYYPPSDTPPGVAADGTSRYHAARINPETGYLNYSMSTWIQLGSVDWETLRESIITYAAEEQLADHKREFLVTRAKTMKKNPNCDLDDVEILTEVLEQFKREFSQ